MSKTTWTSKYFCGNEVSEYGQQNGYIDYATLAKAFDAVLNNNIISVTGWENWEQENGYIDNSEEIDELNEKIEALEDERAELETCDTFDGCMARLEAIEAEIFELEQSRDDYEYEQDNQPEIFQYYIISDQGAEILKDYTDEIIYYNSNLDMYVWGVTHYGTSWNYVLTDIKLDLAKGA